MRPWLMLTVLLGTLNACAARETFGFSLVSDVGRGATLDRVTSSANVSGEVDNAGFLTLQDSAWGLAMNLQDLSPGNHAISANIGDLQIWQDSGPSTYNVSLGGTCNVWLDAHASTNGSLVTGHFDCKGLVSTTGRRVDVANGSFEAPINDPANVLTQ